MTWGYGWRSLVGLVAFTGLLTLTVVYSGCDTSGDGEEGSITDPETPVAQLPRCVLEPGPTVSFGDTIIGDFTERVLTIRNANTVPASENTFTYEFLVPGSSPDCGAFSFPGAPATGVIGSGGSSGGSVDVTVRFSPAEVHDYSCQPSLVSWKMQGGSTTSQQIANPCPSNLSWSGEGEAPPPPPVVWDECNENWFSDADLHGVYSEGVLLSHIFIAGGGGTLLVGDGSCGWSSKSEAPSIYLLNVTFKDLWVWEQTSWPVSEYEIWAVGNRPPEPGTYGETGTIVKYSQIASEGTWAEYEPGWLITYGSVWGSGRDDIWFGGLGVSTDFPNARYWDGTEMDTLIIDLGMSEITSIHGTAQNDVWATLNQSFHSIYHFDGSSWSNQHQPFMNQPLHDVWAAPNDHVFAVGEDGAIYHFDGSTWVDESIDTNTDLFGVWSDHDSPFAIAVGEHGAIYHRSQGVWTLQPLNLIDEDPTLRDVVGFSEMVAFAVGDDGQILKMGPGG